MIGIIVIKTIIMIIMIIKIILIIMIIKVTIVYFEKIFFSYLLKKYIHFDYFDLLVDVFSQTLANTIFIPTYYF